LLDDDCEDLATAVALLSESSRPLVTAAARENLAAALVRAGRPTDAVHELDAALAACSDAGAVMDAVRVRGQLRELGEWRPQIESPTVPPDANGLTESERLVIGLVEQGLSNREVADRLYVSPHTVATHLGHAFDKLGVRSRSELRQRRPVPILDRFGAVVGSPSDRE
jgi:DNA-binding NarL/FixJ family response regulator